MSCDYAGTMRGLYGERALEGEGWLKAERSEAEEATRKERRGMDRTGAIFDDEYDNYDENEVDYDDDDDDDDDDE